jgi:penicillin-binding protein 2|tara:strand:- start:1360 stop:3195 length:1836 start_codon:yes stop_codon:yes gene_type:complete
MIDLQERFIERKSFIYRLFIVYFMFGGLLLAVLYQTFQLQIANYSEYEIAALENKTHEMNIQPTRGIIYDRDGNILVKNIPTFNLIAIPNKVDDPEFFIAKIKSFIDITEEEENIFYEKFKSKARYNRELVVKTDLDQQEIASFKVRKHNYPNLLVEKRYSRHSDFPNILSHVLGYIGSPSDDELSSILTEAIHPRQETIFSYANGFISGKSGIEKTFDNSLRGEFGEKVYEVDARGKLLQEISYTKPKEGNSIFTSLDLGSHIAANEALKGRMGAVVAVEIDTGAIVTLFSSPSYSINDLSNGISNNQFNALIQNPNKPFFNRALRGRYPPASTIKPALGIFGLQNKLIDWNFSIEDPGFFTLPEDGRIYRGWKKGGHGTVDLEKALIVSSNTYFFSLAYRSDINQLADHLSKFGFGKKVCLDCFDENEGLIPDPQWKRNKLNSGWSRGDTVNLGVGQGYMVATPIQLAYYSSILAKKGAINKLSLVQSEPNQVDHGMNLNNFTKKDWDRLHIAMTDVIDSPAGTSRRLKDLKSFQVAAKSGTAELVSLDSKEDYLLVRQNEAQRDHAIMIAFGPMPDPKYAVSVVIENGESGGAVAGPVAISVLKELIK